MTSGPHPIFAAILEDYASGQVRAGMLADMERTHARMAKQPQTRGVCRCQRFGFPHQYEPACAITQGREA